MTEKALRKLLDALVSPDVPNEQLPALMSGMVRLDSAVIDAVIEARAALVAADLA